MDKDWLYIPGITVNSHERVEGVRRSKTSPNAEFSPCRCFARHLVLLQACEFSSTKSFRLGLDEFIR